MSRRITEKAAAALAAQQAQNEPTRDDLYAQAKDLGLTGLSKATRAELLAAIEATRVTPDPEPEALDELEEAQRAGEQREQEAAARYQAALNDPDAPKPEENAGKRLSEALKEQRALKAWQQGGEKGERPITTNYDAIAAQYHLHINLATATRTRTKREKPEGSPTRPKRGERGRLALEAKKAAGGKRGPGTKMTLAEQDAYMRRMKAEHPESTWLDEFSYGYWIEGLALSRPRFRDLWDTLAEDVPVDEAGDDPVETAPSKPVASRKATTKRAAAKPREVTPNFKKPKATPKRGRR